MKSKLIHTPEGVRDIYNGECTRKLVLQEALHQVMLSYGYKDIQTPTFEFFDVFSKEVGTIPSTDLYKFFDREGNTLVLRPDFTPSIARAAAKYFMDEEIPIRLCYMGNTFTNNSSYQGRLKETTQLGAELIGDNRVDSDAEVIALAVDCLLKAGLKDFQINIGQIDFFKGLLEEAGINEETEDKLRYLITNRNNFGVEELFEEHEIPADLKKIFLTLPELFGPVSVLSRAKSMTENQTAINAIERLEDVYQVLTLYGLDEYVSFDLSMLGKYEYYTGIIFRGYTFGSGDAIVKGGRYDNLLKSFGKNAPSIGFGIVADQLISALSRQKIEIPIEENKTLILYHGTEQKFSIRLANHFRSIGMKIELMRINNSKIIDDYIAFAKRNHMGGILLFENDKKIQVINVITGDIQYTNIADMMKEV